MADQIEFVQPAEAVQAVVALAVQAAAWLSKGEGREEETMVKHKMVSTKPYY